MTISSRRLFTWHILLILLFLFRFDLIHCKDINYLNNPPADDSTTPVPWAAVGNSARRGDVKYCEWMSGYEYMIWASDGAKSCCGPPPLVNRPALVGTGILELNINGAPSGVPEARSCEVKATGVKVWAILCISASMPLEKENTIKINMKIVFN